LHGNKSELSQADSAACDSLVERNFDISPSGAPISGLLSQALFGGCDSKSGPESLDFSLKSAGIGVTVTEFAVTESDSAFYRDQMRACIAMGPFRRFGAWFSCDSGTATSAGNRIGRDLHDLRQLTTCL
jgi:hypothetical protein